MSFSNTLLTLFLIVQQTSAQQMQFTFERVSAKHSLPSANVPTVYQDSKGFMWFGTDAGLCKFDGYDVKVFKSNPADTTTLSSNSIWSIVEDKQSNLWIGTYERGLNRLDLKTERITHYKNVVGDATTISGDGIKSLYVDRSGALWVGTYGAGLCRYNASDNTFTRFKYDQKNQATISNDTVFSIVQDSHGTMWIGTNRGLNEFIPSQNSFRRYFHDQANAASLSDNGVLALFEDSRQHLWIGTRRGVNILDKTTRTFTRYTNKKGDASSLSNNAVYAIAEHRTSNGAAVFIGTEGAGVDMFVEEKDAFTNFRNDSENESSLSDNNISSLFTDRAGTLWIGTFLGGVNRINAGVQPIRHLTSGAKSVPRLPSSNVVALTAGKNSTVYFGIENFGVYRYDGAEKMLLLVEIQPTVLLETLEGNLWIGTEKEGLHFVELPSNKIESFRHDPDNASSISDDFITSLLTDRGGLLWVGTNNGLNRYDPATKRFTRFMANQSDPNSLSHNRVRPLLESSDGTIWIGTEGGGLNVFNKATQRFSHFRFSTKDSTSLSSDLIYSICEDRDGALWVGTLNGLNKKEVNSDRFKRLFEADGLTSDNIAEVIEDNQGDVWVTTARGVSRFSRQRNIVTNFDSRDGFVNSGFSGGHALTNDGTLYLGGRNGIDILHPTNIRENQSLPNVVIVDYTGYKPSDIRSMTISYLDAITGLEWNQNTFSISFSAIDYTNPEKNLHRYEMFNEDDGERVSTGNRRFADFTSLPPGNYRFTAYGANNNGIWNNNGTTLRFEIKQKFWKTWWFISLSALTFVGLLTLFYNVRVSQLLAIEKLKTRIASDLHDEVGSSLSAVALITDMVRRKVPMQSQEFKHLTTATEATRTTTDTIRDLAWVLNPENEKNSDISLRMKDIASRMLATIPYSFDTDSSAIAQIPDMEFRWNVLMIFKEILNNTAKYSKASHVVIDLKTQNDILSLTVHDNGIGFDLDTVKRGNGFFTQKSRSEKIGGEFEIASKQGEGTRTTLTAKIPRTRYDMYEAFHRTLKKARNRLTMNKPQHLQQGESL